MIAQVVSKKNGFIWIGREVMLLAHAPSEFVDFIWKMYSPAGRLPKLME